MSDWFEEWFDSTYYHLLYAHRDESEAKHIIQGVLDHLQPAPKSVMLDLACGKGRHTRILSEAGYPAVGIDLSGASILAAKEFETETLQFFQHDMRLPFREKGFDYIFNFFTSFGYFNSEEDHCKAMESIAVSLREGGTFLIDYLNSPAVAAALVPENEVVRDGVSFKMKRMVSNGYFIKDIWITDGKIEKHYQEKVRAFELDDLVLMIEDAGMEVLKVLGDYDLNPYEENESSRMIIIARKSQ